MTRAPLIAAALALAAPSVVASHVALAASARDDAPRSGPHQRQDAPAPVSAELVLLHGTNSGTGIDPRVGKIPALTKPPFSAYDSYDLLKREALPLLPNRPATTKLPNKGDLVITYSGPVHGRKTGAKKYVVDLSIQRHGAAILPLLKVNATPGEMLFAAVPGFRGGVLVIGLKVVP
ncbi:MAG TPA: hypothetical protein VHB21_16815 [Minicystis sp.]|nr:hypothetical protein [Minicystis sp.]